MEKIEYYIPANGTEGMIFMSQWCDNCLKHPKNPDAKNQCKILQKSFFGEFVKQWVYKDGKPTCIRFIDRKTYIRKRSKLKRMENEII